MNLWIILTGIFFLAADQTIKNSLIHTIRPHESIPIIQGVFHITLVLNPGCAFGLLRDHTTILFILIAFVAIGTLIYFLTRLTGNQQLSQLALILMLVGAVSNLIDRLRFGYVIDFLDFRIWPVFNLGDTAITVGASILILRLMLQRKPKPSQSD